MNDKTALSPALAATYEAGLARHLEVVQERDDLKKKLEELQHALNRAAEAGDQLQLANGDLKAELQKAKETLSAAIKDGAATRAILAGVQDLIFPYVSGRSAPKPPPNIADRLEADLRRGEDNFVGGKHGVGGVS